MARRIKSLAMPESGYGHREHRSKKGRIPITSFHYVKTNKAYKKKLKDLSYPQDINKPLDIISELDI